MFVVFARQSATEKFSVISLHKTIEGALSEAAEIEYAHKEKNLPLFNGIKRDYNIFDVTEKFFLGWVLEQCDPYIENLEWFFKFANVKEYEVQE